MLADIAADIRKGSVIDRGRESRRKLVCAGVRGRALALSRAYKGLVDVCA